MTIPDHVEAWLQDRTRHSGGVYTLDGLAAEAGVTPRTVRYYIQRKLIPPALPINTGSSYCPCYGIQHLEAIRRVKAIREANMTLADVRDRLYPDIDHE